MEVNLVDFTGKFAPDPADYAGKLLIYAKSTRLEQGPETREKIGSMNAREAAAELEYIANSIRSSWEFIDYWFEVRGVTRAFTHQFVRTRVGISFAQQAQRVADMGHFDYLVPQTVIDAGLKTKWDDHMAAVADFYREMQDAGVPNQDCRGVLPTNVKTNIMGKLNLRTLADLAAKRQNLRAQGEYGEVVSRFKELALGVHPWIAPFLDPERTSTPFLDALLARELGTAGPLDKPDLNEALKELDKLKAVWG